MFKKFLILFTERVGSTYVVSRLDKHPCVFAREEILANYKHDENASMQNMKDFYEATYGKSITAIGFKVKHRHIPAPSRAAAYFAQRVILVISLKRRNVVKQAISSIRANILAERSAITHGRERWNAIAADQLIGPTEIPIPVLERQIAYLQRLQSSLDEFIGEHELQHIEMIYEDLLVDRLGCDATLGEVLDVDPTYLDVAVPDTYKNKPDDLRESVVNFDDLLRHFKDTPYVEMLEEVIA